MLTLSRVRTTYRQIGFRPASDTYLAIGARYFILEGSVIVLPATMNVPEPR